MDRTSTDEKRGTRSAKILIMGQWLVFKHTDWTQRTKWRSERWHKCNIAQSPLFRISYETCVSPGQFSLPLTSFLELPWGSRRPSDLTSSSNLSPPCPTTLSSPCQQPYSEHLSSLQAFRKKNPFLTNNLLMQNGESDAKGCMPKQDRQNKHDLNEFSGYWASWKRRE
jgi:hypothetical protein